MEREVCACVVCVLNSLGGPPDDVDAGAERECHPVTILEDSKNVRWHDIEL